MITDAADDPLDAPDLGPCCVCGGLEDVQTIVMLDKKAPIAGTGWGCVVCDLPSDGAVAVVCDLCAAAFESVSDPPFQYAVSGWPGAGGRVPIGELQGTHAHDLTKHPESALEFQDHDPEVQYFDDGDE